MRPRFSLRQLLAFVVFVAVGCGALVAPSPWMAATIHTLTAGLLGFAVVAAVGKNGPARAFWIGFAVIGWGYLWLANSDEYDVSFRSRDTLVTHKLLWLLWDIRYPDSPESQRGMSGRGGGRGMFAVASQPSSELPDIRPEDVQGLIPFSDEDYEILANGFFRIGHALWALVFAYLGGCLTRAFYDRRGGAPEGR